MAPRSGSMPRFAPSFGWEWPWAWRTSRNRTGRASLRCALMPLVGWAEASCSPAWLSISGVARPSRGANVRERRRARPSRTGHFGTSGIRSIWQASRCCWAWACSIPLGVPWIWACRCSYLCTFTWPWSGLRSLNCGGASARSTRSTASESRGGFLFRRHAHAPPNRAMQLTALHAAADRQVVTSRLVATFGHACQVEPVFGPIRLELPSGAPR